jgi:hypothetical protein
MYSLAFGSQHFADLRAPMPKIIIVQFVLVAGLTTAEPLAARACWHMGAGRPVGPGGSGGACLREGQLFFG